MASAYELYQLPRVYDDCYDNYQAALGFIFKIHTMQLQP